MEGAQNPKETKEEDPAAAGMSSTAAIPEELTERIAWIRDRKPRWSPGGTSCRPRSAILLRRERQGKAGEAIKGLSSGIVISAAVTGGVSRRMIAFIHCSSLRGGSSSLLSLEKEQMLEQRGESRDTRQYLVQEKEEKLDPVETPVEAAEVESSTDAAPEEFVADKTEEAPAAVEESCEIPEEESGDQEVVEQTPEIKLETAPADFRFPTTNQSRHCFTRYIEYHRCIAAKGEDATECDKFARYYRSLCPGEWCIMFYRIACGMRQWKHLLMGKKPVISKTVVSDPKPAGCNLKIG
ncbi:hypothetical protein HHK36_003970 [Tetracentron sinense]|uniref:Cytochrome c oxidase subunit 6b-1 n=1 Tax=Tetracentron sinense TaxID=13715 RepID=A0A835DPU5_TETSI|nr:hypothetical protein HHK36_003970 [Tetracentron sinense]